MIKVHVSKTTAGISQKIMREKESIIYYLCRIKNTKSMTPVIQVKILLNDSPQVVFMIVCSRINNSGDTNIKRKQPKVSEKLMV